MVLLPHLLLSPVLPSLLLLLLLSPLESGGAAEDPDSLVIRTTTGKVRGARQRTDQGKEVDMFWGIPFAEPPVGDLRFKAPVPVKECVYQTQIFFLHLREIVSMFLSSLQVERSPRRPGDAQLLRADPGHDVPRLPRRHHVEPKHAHERGLPLSQRGGARAQTNQQCCDGAH